MALNRLRRLVRPFVIVSLLILTACGSLGTMIVPGIQTNSGSGGITEDQKSLLCGSFQPINPNRGKPGGASVLDIQGALLLTDPIPRSRNLLGDTSKTLAQIDEFNAVYDKMCPPT